MSYYNGPYKFAKRSKEQLETLHPDLQKVLEDAITIIDFSIIQGHRGKEEQNKYFKEGRSKLKFPQSKHNKNPSRAVDIAPYPIDFSSGAKVRARFYMLMGIIYAIASDYGIKLRFGLDWDSDFSFTDQTFDDLCHVELL